MRLTALCVCGTLLAFSILSWTIVDSEEGDLFKDNGFWPCAATLRPEGPCRLGQDESTCPYLFSMPPLTVHLPKQFSELEKILEDLQKLKDNVDQLRKMCADCTVSQTERECGRQGEGEHDKLIEGTVRHQDKNWLNEKNPERLKELRKDCGTDRVKAETLEGDSDTDSEKRKLLEEKAKNKWEAERESITGDVKEEKKTLKEAKKDGKTQKEGAREKDKLGQAKVPNVSGNDGIVDMVRKMVDEENNRKRETDRSEEKDGKRNLKGDREDVSENGKNSKITSDIKIKKKAEESDHHVWRHETKETERKTQTEGDRGHDGIKMSEDHDEHTKKEGEQHREERKKEMEKGIKAEQNNEKPKQTESIGRTEKVEPIKEGEEKNRETGEKIKTEGEKTLQSVQRDGDGESGSSKATERTDFVSIRPTPQFTIGSNPRHFSLNSNEDFASSPSSPQLSSPNSQLTTGDTQGTMIPAGGLPPQGTGLGATGISEHVSPDAEAGFRVKSRPTTTAVISTLGGSVQWINSASLGSTSIPSTKPRAGIQGRVSSSMATTTTTPSQHLHTTTFPGITDHSHWTAKTNIGSNTESGVIPLPGPGPKPGEKHKPVIKPEADGKLKNPKNNRKPDQAPLADKKTKHDQKQKPQEKSSTDQKFKPGKDPKRVHISKPQQPSPGDLPTDQNIQILKPDHEHEINQNQKPTEKPKSHKKSVIPVQRTTSHQRPQTVNSADSDKDPLPDPEPEFDEIPINNQNSKPEEKPESEEKPKPNQRFTLKHYFKLDDPQEPELDRHETISLTPKPYQMPVTELMENYDGKLSAKPKSVQDGAPGVQVKPPDQKPKPSQKLPKTNQKQKPGQTPKLNRNHPDLETGQKTKPNLKPKPGKKPQTKKELKTPWPNQMPNPSPKSVPDDEPETEPNKTSKPWTLPRHRPPTRPTVKPGATSVQRPKPSLQFKPSPKTKTASDPPPISRSTSGSIQNSQTDMPPASGCTADVTRSPGDTEFSPSKMKTITLNPKTSNSLETAPFSPIHTLAEGYTMSPNSRITSDLRPQTASKPPSIPMTTSPNKIMPRNLPSVILSTGPGSTKPKQVSNTDSRLQDKHIHNVEETAPAQPLDLDKMTIPVPSPSVQTISTTSPDLRSTNQATSGPKHLDPEASTPSARELRVKINQVAAFFNNSFSPNGRLPDRPPVEHPEDNQGKGGPDKLPTLISSKVTLARRDCSDYLLRGETKSGVYLVTPDLRSRSFPVFCDMELDGGGWTLLQRRQDGSVNFNRTWVEYRSGFGDLDRGEFWLGNNMMHLLTRDRDMMLRVELEDFDGVMEYAEYEQFSVASERMRYRLTVGGYSGTAGDALRFSKSYDHNNRAFTTPDRDHDRYPSGNCGAYYSSGWWFDACMAANLNGRYYVGKYKGVRDGIFWGTWHNISTEYYPTNDRQSFKAVRMMIRPKGFKP